MNDQVKSRFEDGSDEKKEIHKMLESVWTGREMHSILNDCLRLKNISLWMLDKDKKIRTERCLASYFQPDMDDLLREVDEAELQMGEKQKMQLLTYQDKTWIIAKKDCIYSGELLGYYVYLDYVRDEDNLEVEQKAFWEAISVFSKIIGETIARQISFFQLTQELHRLKENEKTAAEVNKQLQYENDYDMLTKVHSRKYFFDAMDEANKREDLLPISVIVGDVNNLKFTNDMYGHRHGDWLLIVVAEILQEEADAVRKELGEEAEYVVARCGGDEFFVMLPHAKRAVTNYYCKRVNERLEKVTSCCITPTISLGSAKKSDMTQDLHRMMEIADAKMYSSKNQFKQGLNFFEEMMDVLYKRKFLTPNRVQLREDLSRQFAEYLKWDEEQISQAILLARYQDIGLTIVPERIWFKEGKYSEAEWREIKKHPQVGAKLALLDSEISTVSDCIKQTHENWDGSGWTRGLKGFEIHVVAQLVRVVTEFVDWLQDGEEIAKKRMEENKDHIFSASLADDFLHFLKEEKIKF